MRTIWLLFSFLCIFSIIRTCSCNSPQGLPHGSTDVANKRDNRLLLFATLEGTLAAIERETGQVLWKIKDKPVVKVPVDIKDAIVPVLLPDPRDGSLYLVGGSKEPLKKLPFSIPELVSSSPCRSSDGILYTGQKKDSWFILDPKTGQREQVVGWDKTTSTCPVQSSDAVYVGRTHYSIMMVDTRNSNRKWNITFYDYTAMPMRKEDVNKYELVHFTSSSTGRIVTMDKRRGNIFWDGDLGSPVIAAYLLDKDGLYTIPFTSMANHTLEELTTYFLTHQQPMNYEPDHLKLYPTLYIGEHSYGLYALPSFIDKNVVAINPLTGPIQLNGLEYHDGANPYPGYLISHKHESTRDQINIYTLSDNKGHFVIFFGHYNVPDFGNIKVILNKNKQLPVKLLTDASAHVPQIREPANSVGVQTEFEEDASSNISLTDEPKKSLKEILGELYNTVKLFINMQENKGLKLTLIVLVGCIIGMFWYLQMQVREFQNLSQNGSRGSQGSSLSKNGAVTAVAEELPDGLMRVGKIMFHPEELLGKGCEGTFVYRGEFDRRKVAVKRLLPECFNFADREVALLRESDAHPNVVRYYCTEQDRMFRYIALELCQATLSDYVQGKCDRSRIDPLEILRQAACGLAHLHSLDIVHRDIKPHNVLISMPDNKGNVRAMISDFGLCKKLQVGRVSFSRRSGVTGTDGWIAPEMLNGNDRTTCAVDLFSLGCLFYYVLSEGSHPFGDTLRRQANILSGESTFDDLKGPEWQVILQKPLIIALISYNASERPPCGAILSYPVFWDCKKILAFFQDVSDRVEKADLSDPVLCTLERNASAVVRGDWRQYIHDEVAKDLRKYRNYRGESVRDLLRALRNKKHHFRELSEDAQKSLGDTPEKFTNYWLSRFPLLLVHTWLAIQCVADETMFSHYYTSTFRFPDLDYADHESNDDVVQLNPDFEYKNDGFATERWNSPRKAKKIRFSDQNFKRVNNRWNRDEKLTENVGLYRNLKSLTPKDDRDNVVDAADVKLEMLSTNNTKLDKVSRKKGGFNRQSAKSKTVDEPMVWTVTEKKSD